MKTTNKCAYGFVLLGIFFTSATQAQLATQESLIPLITEGENTAYLSLNDPPANTGFPIQVWSHRFPVGAPAGNTIMGISAYVRTAKQIATFDPVIGGWLTGVHLAVVEHFPAGGPSVQIGRGHHISIGGNTIQIGGVVGGTVSINTAEGWVTVTGNGVQGGNQRRPDQICAYFYTTVNAGSGNITGGSELQRNCYDSHAEYLQDWEWLKGVFVEYVRLTARSRTIADAVNKGLRELGHLESRAIENGEVHWFSESTLPTDLLLQAESAFFGAKLVEGVLLAIIRSQAFKTCGVLISSGSPQFCPTAVVASLATWLVDTYLLCMDPNPYVRALGKCDPPPLRT